MKNNFHLMATFMCYFGWYPPSSSLCGAVNMNIQYLLPILLSQRVAIVSPRIKNIRIFPYTTPPLIMHSPSTGITLATITTNKQIQSDQDPSRGCSGAGHHTGRLLLSPTTTTHQLQAAIRSVPRLLLNVLLTLLG